MFPRENKSFALPINGFCRKRSKNAERRPIGGTVERSERNGSVVKMLIGIDPCRTCTGGELVLLADDAVS